MKPKIPRAHGVTSIGQAPRIIPPSGTLERCKHGVFAPRGDTSNCWLCTPIRPDPLAPPLRKKEAAA
jgi:hypothetical protein